jgi:hypothetical protein
MIAILKIFILKFQLFWTIVPIFSKTIRAREKKIQHILSLYEKIKIHLITGFQENRGSFVQIETRASNSNNSKSRDVKIFWIAYSLSWGDSEDESIIKNC